MLILKLPLKKHMFKHKPVQDTKLKTELNGKGPTAPPAIAPLKKYANKYE